MGFLVVGGSGPSIAAITTSKGSDELSIESLVATGVVLLVDFLKKVSKSK